MRSYYCRKIFECYIYVTYVNLCIIVVMPACKLNETPKEREDYSIIANKSID